MQLLSSVALAPARTVGAPPAEALAAAAAALEKDFAERCPASVRLDARAQAVLPGGVSHDSRHLAGPSLFVKQARGARKLDPDWNSYVDYWVGHGSLLLGHSRREIIDAVQAAALDATHPGACHEREVQWAELILKLVPGAERVRFAGSGSEATALAVRVARARTGKSAIIKFQGHFHGWLDHAVEGVDPPFDVPFSIGVPAEVRAFTRVLPARDLDLVAATLARSNDIAALILEPTGASGGSVPLR
ncbi:MAG: aminotransferase class III-fold pyridoxal phosphate-dependent enzyme, partial [Candidatus Rokubacteria bacterium]|nr:aminotransferase class III-fold pyridoxal phosphate-dependent enzyme [Candidatus Rokubacteria bacterium]